MRRGLLASLRRREEDSAQRPPSLPKEEKKTLRRDLLASLGIGETTLRRGLLASLKERKRHFCAEAS